ncbi:tryptophanyl-tRNA synthetase [Metarhizium album ARSEF 1941]|uniref:tryptophan--tRNA ligase n=1 Tax=Metarhizium album (strain ARSEF 1941) TaxID=1081103 RepID=A0A0B2WPM4_METAS|nr:tryptophanyl-tRNA synthetase [Metarhizium album ARSEF 1941]KHN95589.1 tryptophanyl-tRNA synthetase [Metarhizium album ARSEF 1941]
MAALCGIPNGEYVRLVDVLSTVKLNSEPVQKAHRVILNAPPNAKHDEFIASSNAQRIDQKLLDRFAQLTGRKPHRYLRRGIVFSHRDLHLILDRYQSGLPIYLFTGRGPSSDSLHLGHSIPFEFTKWLQETLGAKLILMLTDDMKILHDKDLPIQHVRKYDIANATDILAFGFDLPKTFMFSNMDYVGGAFYQNIISIARHITVSSIKEALGFTDDDNVGMFYCCSTQSAGCFASSFPGILTANKSSLRTIPCLIPCSYDIDGYFAEVRKHAGKMGELPPSFLYSSLLPSLQGGGQKMSASVKTSAIYLTDEPDVVREKIHAAFPIGQNSMDVALEWLRFFLEDDEELATIQRKHHAHQLLSVELREILVEVIIETVTRFKTNRQQISNDVLKAFMTPRLLE